MQSPPIIAEQRILETVTQIGRLTEPAQTQPARERLCELVGYRLYRSLVAGLATP
jgi:hypothetical protein